VVGEGLGEGLGVGLVGGLSARRAALEAESFLEKKARGCHSLFTCCIRAAPMALADASVKRPRRASGTGWASRVASLRASWQDLKAVSNSGVQFMVCVDRRPTSALLRDAW